MTSEPYVDAQTVAEYLKIDKAVSAGAYSQG